MWKWVAGIVGTVIAGVLLQLSTDFLGIRHKDSTTVPVDRQVVMGPLELGTNRQGNDFDAYGKAAANAELCAEMCRSDTSCDAMTYVKSTGLCWLKSGIPAPTPNPDMVSSIKTR
jgi:hypothetical protein